MKKIFLIGIAGFAIVFGVGFFLWKVAQACYDMFSDWRFSKELDEVREEAEARRAQRREEQK